jgi:bacterioferritin-associated ferredoxin
MCVCHRRSFQEVREMAVDLGLATLDELVEHKVCGTGCAMCHPYVRKMLATGETAFRIGDWGTRSA